MRLLVPQKCTGQQKVLDRNRSAEGRGVLGPDVIVTTNYIKSRRFPRAGIFCCAFEVM